MATGVITDGIGPGGSVESFVLLGLNAGAEVGFHSLLAFWVGGAGMPSVTWLLMVAAMAAVRPEVTFTEDAPGVAFAGRGPGVDWTVVE